MACKNDDHKVLGFHRGVSEDTRLVEYDDMSLLLSFWGPRGHLVGMEVEGGYFLGMKWPERETDP